MDDRAGMLGHTAPAYRAIKRSPSIADARVAVGDAHATCAALAATIRGLAYALSDPACHEQPARLSASAGLDVRSATWRLHHLADALAGCHDASEVALEALDALLEVRSRQVDA